MDLFWMWPVEASSLDEENNDNDNDDNDNDNASSASERDTHFKRTTEPSAEKLLPEQAHICVGNSRLGTKLCLNGTGEREADADVGDKGLKEYLFRIVTNKVLVVCHMYTICYSFVDKAVWWLMGWWWLCCIHHHCHRTVRKGTD